MSTDTTPDDPGCCVCIRALRRAGMTMPEIAARLHLPLEAVHASADFSNRAIGARLAVDFNSRQEVAEALEQFSCLIGTVEREIWRLERTVGAPTAHKQKAIALAADLIERRLKLAYSLGLLDPVATGTTGSVPDATAIRERLRAAGALDGLDHLGNDLGTEQGLSDGEHQWNGLTPGGSKKTEKE